MTEQELMLTSILDCRRIDLYVDREPHRVHGRAMNPNEVHGHKPNVVCGPKGLSPAQQNQYGQMRRRRLKGEPLQYILGECDFMGIRLFVDGRVLIPRPETEILVDFAIQEVETMRALSPRDNAGSLKILDLGTGTGNIAIALTKNVSSCQVINDSFKTSFSR